MFQPSSDEGNRLRLMRLPTRGIVNVQPPKRNQTTLKSTFLIDSMFRFRMNIGQVGEDSDLKSADGHHIRCSA